MSILCIYHGACADGFGAAWSVRNFFQGIREPLDFHAGIYQSPPPDVTGRDVIMVDFSYKRPVIEEMEKTARSIIILDHHKTAQEDLIGLNPLSPMGIDTIIGPFVPNPGVHVLFDMTRSGAGLAWDYFHSGAPRPEFINYLEDRDLWTKVLPGVDEFTAALRSYPQDFDVWDRLASGSVNDLITEGVAIQRYYRTLVESAKGHAYRRKIAGYDVPVVNASLFMASEVAGELAEGEPFAAVYAESPDRIIYSLRSRAPDGMDVSAIAKRWGGGGHKHAAGFSVRRIAQIDLP